VTEQRIGVRQYFLQVRILKNLAEGASVSADSTGVTMPRFRQKLENLGSAENKAVSFGAKPGWSANFTPHSSANMLFL
jgi:hypothetical protein